MSPWERITTPTAVERLLTDSGIEQAEIMAEEGRQTLVSAEDWWTVVLGSGHRWTVEQMDNDTSACRSPNKHRDDQARASNLD
jgi:hypothetical protein